MALQDDLTKYGIKLFRLPNGLVYFYQPQSPGRPEGIGQITDSSAISKYSNLIQNINADTESGLKSALGVNSVKPVSDTPTIERIIDFHKADEQSGQVGDVSIAATKDSSGLIQGKAYKFPDSNKIYVYNNGKLEHIKDESDFKQMYGGLPQDGFNFTTIQKSSIPNTTISGTFDVSSGGGVSEENFWDFNKLPDDIKNAEWFKVLSDENKKLLTGQYYSQIATSEAQKAKYAGYLKKAQEYNSPYFRQASLLIEDELTKGIQNTIEDYGIRSRQIQENIKRIDEDLALNKDRLSIDQQAELERQKRKYESELLDIEDKMSSSGMAFSSRYDDVLARTAIEQRNIQTSTNRGYERKIQDIQTESQRKIQDQQLQKEQFDLARKKQIEDMYRTGEKNLGSSNFLEVIKKLNSNLQSQLSGFSQLGGITGGLQQQEEQANIGTANSMMQGFNLNLK